MDLKLTDKRALVSGSTKGIGLAIATALAREGGTGRHQRPDGSVCLGGAVRDSWLSAQRVDSPATLQRRKQPSCSGRSSRRWIS